MTDGAPGEGGPPASRRTEAYRSRMIDRHYTDPRLAAVYDRENSGRWDTDFYLDLADELAAVVVTDLGCGTGALACDLAAKDRHVTGVDPATAMLDIARARSGAQRVTWIEGTAADLTTASSDLIVMAGHVAQVFLDDDEWREVLEHIHRALVPGGHLAFETRNPAARPWERWDRAGSFAAFEAEDGGEAFDSWLGSVEVRPGVVAMTGHTRFRSTGEEITTTSSLRFRGRQEVETDLAAAGLVLQACYGDWDRGSLSATSPEMIFLARRDRRPSTARRRHAGRP